MIPVDFPESVRWAIGKLNAAGYEAWAVGGCVRDSALGKQPHDWDMTTSALPEETMAVFEGCPVIETGLRHGTVTVLVDSEPLEITTYRVDGSYSDSRRPDSVSFTRSLEADLARRDFTINAMAAHPEKGIVDCFGGLEDLKNGVIRCVGEPERRFTEDALRILRALRFSSVLGFPIEPQTANALLRVRENLRHVAMERIFSELKRMLCGRDAGRILREFPQVLWVFLPELQPMVGFEQHNPHHLYDVWEHTIRSVEAAPADEALRLTLLLHDAGKPACFTLGEDGTGHFYGHPAKSRELADAVLRRLRSDNDTRERVLTLIEQHDAVVPATPSAVRRWLGKLGEKGFFDLLSVKRADNRAQNQALFSCEGELDALSALAERILAEDECFTLKSLAVGGRDLMELGIQPGPAMGKLLGRLLEMVVEGKCPNEREALMEMAKKALSENRPENL